MYRALGTYLVILQETLELVISSKPHTGLDGITNHHRCTTSI